MHSKCHPAHRSELSYSANIPPKFLVTDPTATLPNNPTLTLASLLTSTLRRDYPVPAYKYCTTADWIRFPFPKFEVRSKHLVLVSLLVALISYHVYGLLWSAFEGSIVWTLSLQEYSTSAVKKIHQAPRIVIQVLLLA